MLWNIPPRRHGNQMEFFLPRWNNCCLVLSETGRIYWKKQWVISWSLWFHPEADSRRGNSVKNCQRWAAITGMGEMWDSDLPRPCSKVWVLWLDFYLPDKRVSVIHNRSEHFYSRSRIIFRPLRIKTKSPKLNSTDQGLIDPYTPLGLDSVQEDE